MSILTAIKSKNPDGMFYGGMDPQAGPMLRQMETLGMANVKFFGGDGICTEKLTELASGAKTLGNVVCAQGGVSIAKMPGGTEWKKRYDAEFPGDFQVYSPYTYDATMVLVDAMKRAGSADPKVYLPFVAKTNYKGVTTTVAVRGRRRTEEPGHDVLRLQGRQADRPQLRTAAPARACCGRPGKERFGALFLAGAVPAQVFPGELVARRGGARRVISSGVRHRGAMIPPASNSGLPGPVFA